MVALCAAAMPLMVLSNTTQLLGGRSSFRDAASSCSDRVSQSSSAVTRTWNSLLRFIRSRAAFKRMLGKEDTTAHGTFCALSVPSQSIKPSSTSVSCSNSSRNSSAIRNDNSLARSKSAVHCRTSMMTRSGIKSYISRSLCGHGSSASSASRRHARNCSPWVSATTFSHRNSMPNASSGYIVYRNRFAPFAFNCSFSVSTSSLCGPDMANCTKPSPCSEPICFGRDCTLSKARSASHLLPT
mmetsp:Transcript_1065/g.3269  ORF Transcript_1065/g.3269 Transcript_1065/m.3269 type:complete len:241 (-) Transcript_1065:216-938(-)